MAARYTMCMGWQGVATGVDRGGKHLQEEVHDDKMMPLLVQPGSDIIAPVGGTVI